MKAALPTPLSHRSRTLLRRKSAESVSDLPADKPCLNKF